ncbi:hypothetical protein LRAMOSA09175 [Lichtheimia ramosa]|uniref:Arrestin C-terminal-like domain-containing protein n=1 Tax=Lichtheimia ramosa TaxID=688394 RepID=A0A077WHZ5_9FUNG|nr:hypothetical protein LRAMOSA09175 [Lichtheimia ramosa]
METAVSHSQSSFVYQVAPTDLLSIELNEPERTYFPGTVHIGLKFPTPLSRVAIHLSCKARLGQKNKLPLFVVTLPPTNITPGCCRVPFTITVPADIPSSVNHEKVPGKIEYKVKSVYEASDLPSSVWPKASIGIRVHEHISTQNEKYQKDLTSEGKLSFQIPHDIILKQCTFRKGDTHTALAWLHIPRSCFLPDEIIPFTLRVQHFAPIRQMDGVTAYLDRITQTLSDNHGQTIDTTTVHRITLPLSCDEDNFQAKFTCNKLTVPSDTPPTLEKEQYPLRVTYRIRVVINLDMDALPLRKRDRMASYMYMGRKIRLSDDEQAGGPTITLDVPIKVGTTDQIDVSTPTSCLHKSVFDGGFGFFQQGERPFPFSPLLGPPPAYGSYDEKNTAATNNTMSVVMKRLSYPPSDHNSSNNSNNNSMVVMSTPPPPPMTQPLLVEDQLAIARQPSAPSLQEIEKPSLLTSRYSYSETSSSSVDSDVKYAMHARSWSVPAEYSSHNNHHHQLHQYHYQQQQSHAYSHHHPSPLMISPPPPPQYQPHTSPMPSIAKIQIVTSPPPVPNHHHLQQQRYLRPSDK